MPWQFPVFADGEILSDSDYSDYCHIETLTTKLWLRKIKNPFCEKSRTDSRNISV